jgi:peptidyl-prolyl cis-trans isomerase A (cyclophilin A)
LGSVSAAAPGRGPKGPRYTVAVLVTLLLLAPVTASNLITVVIETSIGSIEVAVDPVQAPLTAANFLRYVDAKMYDGGRFHRAVRLDNQVRKDVVIEVIQGGRSPERSKTEKGFGAIPLERTSVTTLKHVDGAISMARGATADSASSDFFLCVGPQPALDFGGARAADGQGFAAFGRVTSGMDVVRRIQAGQTNDREQLIEPVAIVRAYRK